MNENRLRRIRCTIICTWVVILFGAGLLAMAGGCMTIEGLGADVQAAARGIRGADTVND